MPSMADADAPPAGTPIPDALRAGRDAFAAHDWQVAHDRLLEADRSTPLDGEDLESLAVASFFAADPEVEFDARERAYARYEAAGDTVHAAYLAVYLARTYGIAGKPALAAGWVRKAQRLIGPDGDTYAHGYLALVGSEMAAGTGDFGNALALAERAVAIGDAAADKDLAAFAQSNLGWLKLAQGDVADGFALLEEASFAAVSGELTPFTSGVTACRMIGACRDMTDYRRATEWIEATERYCSRNNVDGFPGICRIHRAEVATVSGAWQRAEQELVRATDELSKFNVAPPRAEGWYAIGDVRRLMGDLDGAEVALRQAHQEGKLPQPALALVRLAQGNVRAAVKAIGGALQVETWDRLARSRLLPAQAEIAIAAGDAAKARVAVDELAEIVAGYPSPALTAVNQLAQGRVLLAEGDPQSAVRELRGAIAAWRDVGAPYDLARSRALLSRALRALDDEEDADLELNAALDEFRRLGARVDTEAAEREWREVMDRRSGPTTARRTFMFTDIVGSTRLAETLGDDAWERLLRRHDELLRGLIAGGGGQVVNSTGDGFFAAFETARSAVDTAVAVQEALLDEPHTAGTALAVRIGLHTADATQRGADYSGIGVHVAARIGALAGAGEILASAATLEQAGDVAMSAARSESVRGVTTPVEIAAIAWRA
jgi:class 3 adenylate cyclase